MSLGCARCGDCCDPVGLSGHVIDLIEQWRMWELAGGDRATTEGEVDPSVWFAVDHWTPERGPLTEVNAENGHRAHQCDMFDPVTRLCTAHDDAPPVCKGYHQDLLIREAAIASYFHGDTALARLWSQLFEGTRMEVVQATIVSVEGARTEIVGMMDEIDLRMRW